MHIGKTYRPLEFLAWTRRRTYALILIALTSVATYKLGGWAWLAIPWPVAALLGTAASFIVGFKNSQTYARTQEAQQAWTSIAVATRYWSLICRDFPKDRTQLDPLLRRHLAWLTVLRYRSREPRVWESTRAGSNQEYQRRHYQVAEQTTPLAAELQRVFPHPGLEELLQAPHQLVWLLSEQSATIREMYVRQELAVLHHTEMQKTLKDLLEHQGRVEKIKNFPYPRQYAVINNIFIWCFAAVLPLSLVREFDRLGEHVDPLLAGHMTWLAVPFGVLVAWLYATLDQVGKSTENPFEGGANDVPITHVCRQLEHELRVLLGEVPSWSPTVDPASPILL
jgi:putative membrane protein